MKQGELDFTHKFENNEESENHLNKNRKGFNKKCTLLLTKLCNGEKVKFAESVYEVGDTRRRACDLIEHGVPVQREFLNGENVKTYFLKPEDIKWVKEKYLL